jgi:hypothetical protein
MQADPLGLVDGASVYGYAAQNPMRYTDPTGQCFGPAIAALPWCIMALAMLYDYLSSDCYGPMDFIYSVLSNMPSPWSWVKWIQRAARGSRHHGGGSGGGGRGDWGDSDDEFSPNSTKPLYDLQQIEG